MFSHCTVFICDHCGETIDDTASGIVDYGRVGEDSPATEFRILHNYFEDDRPGCSSHYRQEFNSVMLNEFAEQLIHNSKHKKPKRLG